MDRIDKELQISIEQKIPLIIGEFAHHAPGCSIEIPHKEIMELCHWKKISWLAWSWGPGNSDCREMDMTQNGTFATFKHDSWAEDILTGYFGLQRTSQKTDYILHKGECAPYCAKPILPNKLLYCEGDIIKLSNPLNTKYFHSTWKKNEQIIFQENDIYISSAGNYTLISDSSGCIKSTSVTVYEKEQNIVLASELDLCTINEISLSPEKIFANLEYN